MARRGRFVGVGIDSYECHERLTHAVTEVTAVAEVLGAEFAGEPLCDADEAQAREYVKAVPDGLAGGALVALWCGHGVQSGTKLWLQTRDAGGQVNAAEVVDRCARSGAAQLLFIVDTCQAGAGVAEAGVVASALLEELPRDDKRVWFGILVSCSASDIGAQDGTFGTALLELMRNGPRSADMQRRWSKHNRLIRGDDLGQALLEDWTGEDQHPGFLSWGSAWYMLPNPLWDPGTPEEVVEHLLVAAHVHARGLTADRMAESLDGQLVRLQVLEPEGSRRNAAELIGALQRAAEGGAPRPVLVIDALDEARGEAFTIASELVVRLARSAPVVVSTRPVRRAEPPMSLVEALRPAAVLNLDAPGCQESGRAAMRGYVVKRLAGVAREMDADAVAGRLVCTASQPGDRPFLLARVVTDQLRAAPLDTSTPNWEQYLARSIESAFDIDLARVSPPGFGLPPATTPAGLTRSMLTALTWAFGAGFPEEEWLAVASQLAGVELDREHISWVLDNLGRYVVQDGEDGTAVYRLAHQSVADHLRPPYRRTGEQPFDPAAEPVWAALAARYRLLLESGYPAAAPAYLWFYAYRHAAATGVDGLVSLRELASLAEELRPHIGHAALEVAKVAAMWGHRAEAVAPTEEAVTLYRALADTHPTCPASGTGAGTHRDPREAVRRPAGPR